MGRRCGGNRGSGAFCAGLGIMKNFCILTNFYKDKQYRLTNRMRSFIELKGGRCTVVTEGEAVPDGTEGIFVVGGDGTLIRAAGIASEHDIPLIGVNLGHLGYLCELESDNACFAIEEIMKGNYIVEERMMLSGDGIFKTALNDIVILRKGAMQLMELTVSVNGEYLNTCRADGIIIATPTGSTGYSMSAGGPIIDPKASMILITPVNAHNFNAKSIIVSAEDVVTIALMSRQPQKDERVDVHIDGERTMELVPGGSISIRASNRKTKIMKLSKLSFLEILRRKMQEY